MKRCLLVIMAGIFISAGCAKEEKVVAKVGDAKITAAELGRVLSRKMKLTGQKGATEKDRKEAVNALIDRKLLWREGVRLGIKPSETEINAEVAAAKGKFADEDAFRAVLKEEGLDLAGFKLETEENLVVKLVEERLSEAVKTDEEEAHRYYEGHREDFLAPPSYRIYLLQVGGDGEARRLLEKLRQNPAEFDRQALTEGPTEAKSMNRNAVLTAKTDYPDEMYPFLEKLKKGEVGGPVKTKRGYFLFRLLDKTDGYQKSWQQVKGDVVHLLYQEKRKSVVSEWLIQQRHRVKIEVPE